jgi:Tol biopolymer transport system component
MILVFLAVVEGVRNQDQGPLPQPAGLPSGRRFDSWKEIAQFLNRDVRTVQRWERTGGLPVHRRLQEGKKRVPVHAYEDELARWLSSGPPATPPATEAGRRRVLWVAGALGVVVVGIAVIWFSSLRNYSASPFRVVQVTDYAGAETHPAFSPDGKRLAFSWNGKAQDNFDIYVKVLDTGVRQRLTSDPAVDSEPAWSPDGRFIAFVRSSRGRAKADVIIVPAQGGPEHKVAEFYARLAWEPKLPALSWTADSRWLVVPRTPKPNARSSLALVSVDTPVDTPVGTPETRLLTSPTAESMTDCCPVVSPDGRTLAFLRVSKVGIPNIHLLSLTEDYKPRGEARQLTAEPHGAWDPMWTGSGREVLYRASRQETWMFWRIGRDGSTPPRPLGSLGPIGTHWTISRQGDRLAFQSNSLQTEIWRVELAAANNLSRVVSSGALNFEPQYSPDGKRIAFVSAQPSGMQIRIADSDGANPVKVAAASGRDAVPARWSPDGRQIVFECQSGGNDNICIIPASGGEIRSIGKPPAQYLLPSWSHDGKWICLTSNRSGSFQVWRIPADGSDSGAVQLTSGGGFGPVESADGSVVYYAKELFSGALWQVPAIGGRESPVASLRILGRPHSFAATADGIYYISSPSPEQYFEVFLHRFATGSSERIARIPKRIGDGLSVSPDGRWLLFPAYEDQFGDLYVVENFR